MYEYGSNRDCISHRHRCWYGDTSNKALDEAIFAPRVSMRYRIHAHRSILPGERRWWLRNCGRGFVEKRKSASESQPNRYQSRAAFETLKNCLPRIRFSRFRLHDDSKSCHCAFFSAPIGMRFLYQKDGEVMRGWQLGQFNAG